MDDLGVRAVIIGVGIFVTIMIMSIMIIMFSQMSEIFGLVASTDTSIYNKFDDIYSMYHGKTENGIGLLNTLKKIEENSNKNLIVIYPGCDELRMNLPVNVDGTKFREAVYLKKLMNGEITNPEIPTTYKYEDRYNITVDERENGITAIVYSKIGK